ncbi:hypothetical protein, partial [Parvimonas sp. M20]
VDEIGRHFGETLFAKRYTADTIRDIRIELGSRWFNAMFQQDPDADENAVINTGWFKNIEERHFRLKLDLAIHRGERVVFTRAWDFASTKD